MSLNRKLRSSVRLKEALRRAGRDAREFSDKLLEAQPQGVCAFHADSGRCVLANQRALAIIGATMEQVLAQDFRSLATWKRDGFLAAAHRVLATGTAEYAESHGPSSAGKEAQIQVHFSRFQSRGAWHLLVLLTDITVFRRVEADLEIQRDLHSALRESNEALLRGGDRETLCRGVCAAAVRSGRFNLAWVAVLDDQGKVAARASAGPGKPCLDELDPAPSWLAPSIACIRLNRIQVDNGLAAHGLVSLAAMPLREAGQCVGALNLYSTEPGFFTGERMTLLENLATNLSLAMDLRSAELLLRSLEGLKAKSQIAAYIAHEINNPLAGIKQSFQVIAQAIPEDHPDRPFVGIIGRELDRIAGIIRMAYSFHRPGLPQVRDCLVGETLADLASLLSSRLRPKRLALELPEFDRAPKRRLHEDILRQILFNVLQNAIEASPKGGRIRCRSWRDGGELVVEVEDQGPGVAPDIGARLFEPGFTTKSAPETGGLGMGLATCRNILLSVGGSISFRNLAPARGAGFFLRLPWQDEAAGSPSARGHHE